MGWFKELSKPVARCLGDFLPRERKEDGLRSLELMTTMIILRDEGYLCLYNTVKQERSHSRPVLNLNQRDDITSPQSPVFRFFLF